MLKRFIVVLSFGLMVVSAALVADEGVQDNRQEVITQAVKDITKAQTAQLEAQDANKKQRSVAQALLKLLSAGNETQKRMLEALSPELRTRINKFFAQHKDFVARIHAPHAIVALGVEVVNAIGVEAAENEASTITNLRRHLKEGLKALYAGQWGEMFDAMTKKQQTDVRLMLGDVFAGIVMGGSNPMMGAAKKRVADDDSDSDALFYDSENLNGLVETLVDAEKTIKEQFPSCTAFGHLKQYVTSIFNEDVHAMTQAALLYVDPLYLSASTELASIQTLLYEQFMSSIEAAPAVVATDVKQQDATERIKDNARIERASVGMDNVLSLENGTSLYSSNPYYYWLSTLKKQEGSYTTYEFIKQRFKNEPVGKEYFQLFRLFAHAYTFSAHCLDIYQEQAKSVGGFDSKFDMQRIVPTLLNYALTSSAAANYFFKVQEIARNNTCYDTFMSRGAIADERKQVQALVADYIGMVVAGPMFFGCPLKGQRMQTDLGLSVEKLAASWMYYLVFYNGLFNRNAFFNANGNPDKGNWSLWPAEFSVFQKAFLGATDEAVTFLCKVAEATCYNKLSPDIMEDLDVATLGIVSPSAIKYVVKAFVPMMLLSDFGSMLGISPARIQNRYLLLGGFLDDYGNLCEEYRRPEFRDMGCAAMYAEKTIYDYGCRTIGYNAGHWASSYVSDELYDGAGKVLSGIFSLGDKVGIGMGDSSAMVDVLRYAAMNTAEMALGMVQELLWPSPELEHAMAPFLRGYLLESGYLSFDHDQNAYREAIVNMVLTQLATHKLVEHYDAAVYARMFKRAPTKETVNEICFGIAKNLKKQLVCMSAGKVTEWTADAVGSMVYKKYGPFTPKVKRLFQ